MSHEAAYVVRMLQLIVWLIFELMPQSQTPAAPAKAVTFEADVRPILERRCTPCHFPGGVMHAKLPFDKGETIVKLGTKLFTRIKKEDEQKVIRAFLAASKPTAPAPPAP